MNFPKPVMTIAELRQMGFGKSQLLDMCHDPKQTFAVRSRDGGKWYIDTEEFSKYFRQRARQDAMTFRRENQGKSCREMMKQWA